MNGHWYVRAVIPKLWPVKVFGRAYFIFTILVFSTAPIAEV